MMRGGNGGTPATTTTTIRPAGSDHSGWVLILGGGLIAVNFAFGGGAQAMSYMFSPVKPANIPAVNWAQFVLMALALLFLLGISKTGESGSNFAVIFLVAVWVIYLLNNAPNVAKILGQPSPTSSAPASTSSSTTGNKQTGSKPA